MFEDNQWSQSDEGKREAICNRPSMDIISSLPDPILCHILSFLPIHFSVTTSVLARRWRFLWTYVRDLYFSDLKYYNRNENQMEFSDMVDRVLLLHNGSIDSLIIDSDGDASQCQIDAWISTAIARSVQDLYLSDFSDVRFPNCCFKCNTLVELTLQKCTISVKPGTVCLPMLKKLHLYSNCYENDESLPNLVSGCSAIEDLFIQREEMCEDMACCYVRSPTLKSLVLWFELGCRESDHNYEHKLVLDRPAIQYLEIQDNFFQIILAENLSSVVVAKIRFACDSEENISRWRDSFQLVEKLSDTKSLTFESCAMMKRLNPAFSFATTRFHNLTKLKLEADWHFLTEFLENADKLESLTIREVSSNVDDELKFWREPKHLPKCLLSSLKYVSICGYAGGEHELNMVSYILRYAKVLKNVKINTKTRFHIKDACSKLKMLQQISYFPRGSTECRVTFI